MARRQQLALDRRAGRRQHGLKLSGIDMNRKMLSEMAIYEPEAFTALTEKAKEALKA